MKFNTQRISLEKAVTSIHFIREYDSILYYYKKNTPNNIMPSCTVKILATYLNRTRHKL